MQGLKEVFDKMWGTICEHKTAAEDLAAVWEDEAQKQMAITKECAAPETRQQVRSLQVRFGFVLNVL